MFIFLPKILMFWLILIHTCDAIQTIYRGQAGVPVSTVYTDDLQYVTSAIECARICSRHNSTRFVHCESDGTCICDDVTETKSGPVSHVPTKLCHEFSKPGFVQKVATTPSPITDCSQQRKDIIFVIDESCSITTDDFNYERQFISDVVAKFNLSSEAIRLAVVGVGKTPAIRMLLSANPVDARADVQTFQRIPCVKNSFLSKAIGEVQSTILEEDRGDRVDTDNVVVIVTTATPLSNGGADAAAVGNLLRHAPNTELFVILRTSEDYPSTSIRDFASDPDVVHIFEFENFSHLSALKEIVAEFACDLCKPPCQNYNLCDRRHNVCKCSEDFTGYRCETEV